MSRHYSARRENPFLRTRIEFSESVKFLKILTIWEGLSKYDKAHKVVFQGLPILTTLLTTLMTPIWPKMTHFLNSHMQLIWPLAVKLLEYEWLDL